MALWPESGRRSEEIWVMGNGFDESVCLCLCEREREKKKKQKKKRVRRHLISQICGSNSWSWRLDFYKERKSEILESKKHATTTTSNLTFFPHFLFLSSLFMAVSSECWFVRVFTLVLWSSINLWWLWFGLPFFTFLFFFYSFLNFRTLLLGSLFFFLLKLCTHWLCTNINYLRDWSLF